MIPQPPANRRGHSALECSPDEDECPRCGGDGDVQCDLGRCTCPVCRGSGLSGNGERKLREGTRCPR